MINSQLRSAASRKWLAWCACLGIALLLMTTIAQALDCCELAPPRTAHQFCSTPCPASSAACLICAACHTPSLAAPLTSIVAPGDITSVPGTIGQSFHSALQIFALYVRPPPSL